MCGFVFVNDKSLDEKKFDQALASIFHRGPDDVQKVITEDSFLGFSRLAIMDLSHSGDQPFVHDGKYYLCNGEIYNYKALKQEFSFSYQSGSDCEVLIPMFEKEGVPELLKKIDGEFAFVIYDSKKDDISMLARTGL